MVFTKITNKGDLYKGTEYIIVSESSTDPVAMNVDHATFSGAVAITFDKGDVVDAETIQKLKLAKSADSDTYSFQLINGASDGKYLSYTGGSNALYVSSTLDDASLWTVDFEADGGVIISPRLVPGRKIYYNASAPLFATYATAQRKIQLYVDLTSEELGSLVERKISELLPVIAYAVGYDISDESARVYIEALVSAGVADMMHAGVPEQAILENKLVVSALIIFTNDNLNMAPGDFRTSPMYLANTDKLREQYGTTTA